ncbi:MAG: DUF4259 domain-containing protein [Planctomycetes bacterium]|nr:DUF4259 domain-containing protein [Planctomycetota bacterium]
MGAWGHNSFENDDALDWVADLEESQDMSAILKALNAVTDEAGDYIEAPECSMAIAAAEVVAALCGNAASSLPDEVNEWLKGKPKPDPQLAAKARQAIDVILADSELKELWEEIEEDYPKWIAVLEDIKSRLP